MQAKLKGTVVAGLAVLLCCAAFAAAQMASHAALPSAHAANELMHAVLLKPDSVMPHRFSTKERRNIEDAVREQIRAYAAGDADQAFAKLAPSTQRFFGEPDKFLRSIAQEIPTVLDTRRFAFLGVEQVGMRVAQHVLITDGSGRQWLAEFQLERQKGDDWRIKGCIVEATLGQQA